METLESVYKEPPKTPEQRLWIAVLDSAISDALFNRNPAQKEDARRWFRDAGYSFKMVCDLANYDYGFVRRCVMANIKNASLA
ncbi:MAG: hypothetical protein HQL75_10595 [Magnetococcales bacterium]|nr:hypothetical protein [Magnetococcales bacterium]